MSALTVEQQITRWTRVLDAGELLMLAYPDGVQLLHIYSAHPHGGYRVLTITPDPDGGLPHVGQVRLGPGNLNGWLGGDLGLGYQEHDPDAE